ncbi:MAG: hypothetical protein LQ338_002365 [Usnochroma carphineum]|nr:MAG: hypothetical protein LQ338_002365 [Usnochroma carphineum]
MGAISDFVAVFGRDFDRYSAIEKRIEALCKDRLRDIDFLWHSRVKSPASLENKLRDRSNKYKDEAANVEKIWDLVGGRIILARRKDIPHVERIVRNTFNFVDRTQHPRESRNIVDPTTRFRGYNALHLYVTLQDPCSDDLYRNTVIEIQVMTGFMWEYTTLHHDVEYKRLHGKPTKELLWDIELVRGVANVGELVLKMYDERLFQQDTYPELQARVLSVVGEGVFGEHEARSQSVLQLTSIQHDTEDRAEATTDQRFKDSALETCAYALLRKQPRNKEAHLEGVAKARLVLLQGITGSAQDGLPSIRHLRVLQHLGIAERKLSLRQGLDTGKMMEHLDQAEAYIDKALRLDMSSGLVGSREQMTLERHIVRGLRAKLEFQMRVKDEKNTRRLLSDAAAGIDQALKDLKKVDMVKFGKNREFALEWIRYFQMLHTRFFIG